MGKMVTIALVVFLISVIGAGMYVYNQQTNLDKWGDYRGFMQMAPILFIACGMGGVVLYSVYAIARGRR